MNEQNKKVRLKAMDLLARREHSRCQLAQKLARHHYPSNIITQELDRLEQEKLLSDQRFTDAYIRARRNNGFGPLRIRQELQNNGINNDMIEQSMASTEANWQEFAKQVREKKFGPNLPDDFSTRAKQMRFLQYRGFTQGQIDVLMKNTNPI